MSLSRANDPLTPERLYHERYTRFAKEHDALTWRWNRVANIRLVAFVVAAVLIGWGIWERLTIPLVIGGMAAVVFVALVIIHQRMRRDKERAARWAEVNAEALPRVRREWTSLPLRDTGPAGADHPYGDDLDVVGPASLFHLLETVTTPMGTRALRKWLLTPASLAVIRRRQPAVAELAELLEFRQELAVVGRQGKPAQAPETFYGWAEGPDWLRGRRLIAWSAWLGPILTVALLAAQLLEIIPLPLWVIPVAINLLVAQAVGPSVHRVFERVRGQEPVVQRYADQLGVMLAQPLMSDEGQRLKDALSESGADAPEGLRRLGRVLSFLVPMGSLAHMPLQALFAWDLHLLAGLERWRAQHGAHVRTWLDALGDMEALSALASLAGDNPDWCFPEIDPNADQIVARDLGHPLLAADGRVANDVEVGPSGTFLLVTGSNMSGKSTLLRTIGVNAVLAGAGGPVCATSCRMPPVTLWTSVRVQDSLAAGVSFFMAELLRLKRVVDAAGAHQRERRDGATDRMFLYLLDEILQGTNTTERRIAARRIIARLVDTGALGAVTTHDLDLAEVPPLDDMARPVHFRDLVREGPDGPVMAFDHLMRPGIATTTNALRLMEAIGLALPEPEAMITTR